ncbi:MAG TPA: penicillin-binding transpeptidase domain-containing protein [Gemmatimonadaceae bacterium]|nr:penicillin-binding transpeptidase domain-containing protein [Gemmatimonadaceae bacterium]
MAAASRVTIVQGALILFAIALVIRAGKVQVIDGKKWSERARRQHFATSSLSAPRGDILDANGTPLVETREMVRVAVSLPEVRDTALVIRLLQRSRLDVSALRSAIARKRRWVELPGVHSASQLSALPSLNGVHITPVLRRVYTPSSGVRRIVGGLDGKGDPLDGIELVLDTLLRGDSSRTTVARNRDGRRLESANGWPDPPRAGATVTLTINSALQDIAERQLSLAVDSLGASGGDIVVMNPHTGEILAMATNRVGRTTYANTAITEPFEPGSTLKPFIAAALLSRGRAKPDEIVSTFNGKLELDGRTITDMHKAPDLSLADVIRFSSNVGIVQFGQRLSPREKYDTFRDLGFGMTAGVPLPAEATGTLREPRLWSRQTPASILMGYEIAVTPLQLVTAYSAIANGGELPEPHVVKEIRSVEGKLLYRAEPRLVRRVMSGEVARTIRQMLLSVVQEGTATKADLETFRVGGKSGTARRTSLNAGYTAGNYTASFVGLFPADDPQYVVLVKLDSPRGSQYAGGDIAAPVTRIVLRAALAARDAALDREGLVASGTRADPSDERSLFADTTPAGEPARTVEDIPATSHVVRLPLTPGAPAIAGTPRVVPDVRELSIRNAVRVLHAAGFRVRLVNAASGSTFPAAGSLVAPGSLVQLGQAHE